MFNNIKYITLKLKLLFGNSSIEKLIRILIFVGVCSSHFAGAQAFVEIHSNYNLNYYTSDRENISAYSLLIDKGFTEVKDFFQAKDLKKFDVFIFPDRKSLDSSWQKSWNMPEFKSECWMVASGVSNRFDLISPAAWKTDACEHDFSDKEKTQKLITHELVHVYHGQQNASPDFSATEGIDWFVEGLATYASGQCDSLRMAQVRKAIAENQVPMKLDAFWTGKNKYGLSGSMVMFIDKKYGRKKLLELLPFSKKSEILLSLGVSEEVLLEAWKKFMMK